MDQNQIEKKVFLKHPKDRVWKAITDANEFGSWFGMKLEGPFRAGETMRGQIWPTTADAEVAKLQEPHKGKPVQLVIDKIEPKDRFSFKWHPFAIDPNQDYSKEPMTLITFSLKEEAGGTWLTITETGFENIPISRRAEALKANDGGWAHQCQLLAKYLGQNAS